MLARMITVATFIGVYRASVVPGQFCCRRHQEVLGGGRNPEDGGVFACDVGGEFFLPFLGLCFH